MKTYLLLSLAVFNLTACASYNKRAPNQDTKVLLKDSKGVTKEAPAQAIATGTKDMTPVNPVDSAAQVEEMKQAVANAAQQMQDSQAKLVREVGPVPAEKALGWLKNGNTRFTKGRFRADGTSAKDRLRLVNGQRPHSVVVSCSDSRVPPEIVFDQKLGEIFVMRLPQMPADGAVIEGLETAVATLGTNLIVFMDFAGCESSQLAVNLSERSAILGDAVARGGVKVISAHYDLLSGVIEWR